MTPAWRERLIPLSDSHAWDNALEGVPHFFAHRHAYNAAMCTDAQDVFLYTVEREGFRAACPLMVREWQGTRDIVSPYGFAGFAYTGHDAEFPAFFSQSMAARGYVAGYIVQHPLIDVPAGMAFRTEGKQCFLLDLSADADTRLAAMASDHRSRLRQWWKQQPVLAYNTPEIIASFMELYAPAMERAGASSSYFFSPPTLAALTQGPHALVVGVPGEAASLFVYHGRYAEYYLNACTEDGRRHARGLVWHAAEYLKAQGVEVLNLGCGIVEGDLLEMFKQRFGGKAKRFSILKQVYRTEDYRALCEERGADPTERNGFFPAYRNPALFDKKAENA